MSEPKPARYTLELRDTAGGTTTRDLKARPESGMPKVVLYGGGVFLIEHSRLLFDPAGDEHWVGYYGEVVAFSADLERELVQVLDEVDLMHALADAGDTSSKAIDQALELANVCSACGVHYCGCEWRPGNTDPYAKPCCVDCTHPRFERCGAVAHAQRGIPDGYTCRKPLGHVGALADNGYHQQGQAMWKVDGAEQVDTSPRVTITHTFDTDRRDPICVKKWPECIDSTYSPECCRFPKSCSCGPR